MKLNSGIVLKRIQEAQDELVSEAEHRIKNFDVIHTKKKNQLRKSK